MNKTREEAIKTLKENYCAMCAYGSQDMDSCDIRSCDNRDAIKVLDQEPTTKNNLVVDAVSRQAVLDLIADYDLSMGQVVKGIHALPPVTPQEQKLNTWSLDDVREDFMHDVYNTLDFLPTNEEAYRIIDSFDRVTSSIKQEPRWIPASERLPKANEFEDKVRKYYLVQNEYDDMLVAYYDGRYWSQIYTHSYIKDRIVAWMPLPKEYSEVEE